MISNGFGTVTEELEAKIQARVGEFLQAKAKLLEMQRSPLVDIRDEARDLYAVQLQLETELSPTMSLIEKIKKDSYTMSDITQVGWFAAMLEKHVRDVDDLQKAYKQSGAVTAPAGIGAVDFSKMLPLLAVGLAAYIWIVKR